MLTEHPDFLYGNIDLIICLSFNQLRFGNLAFVCSCLVMGWWLGLKVHFTVNIANVADVDMLPFLNGHTIADADILLFGADLNFSSI
jgi:hypothetical protein